MGPRVRGDDHTKRIASAKNLAKIDKNHHMISDLRGAGGHMTCRLKIP